VQQQMRDSREHEEQNCSRKGIIGVQHEPLARFFWQAGSRATFRLV
jgi:hypothetical protein